MFAITDRICFLFYVQFLTNLTDKTQTYFDYKVVLKYRTYIKIQTLFSLLS